MLNYSLESNIELYLNNMDIFRDDLITLREVSDAYWKLEFRFIGLLTHFGRRLSSPINE